MAVKTMHPKIREVKRRALPINCRALSIDAYGQLISDYTDSLEKRIVKGYLVTWGQKNAYGEIWMKGSCAKSIQDFGPGASSNYKMKFLNQHSQFDPLSLFAVLKEDETGLYFETLPLDDIPSADRVLVQLRSGTLNNFSVGFDYVWDKMEYDEQKDAIIIKEAKVMEGSVVSIPADLNTFATRSAMDFEDLADETEDFINTLPRKDRIAARHLFARYKSLANLEPLEQKREALPKTKPKSTGIDYKFLTNNLKLKA